MSDAERVWLISYDVADPRRLQQIHRLLTDHALAMQYSVFVGAFRQKRLDHVVRGIQQVIDPREDDVRAYPIVGRGQVDVIGRNVEGITLGGLGLLDLLKSEYGTNVFE